MVKLVEKNQLGLYGRCTNISFVYINLAYLPTNKMLDFLT